jgi:hypothetical protein
MDDDDFQAPPKRGSASRAGGSVTEPQPKRAKRGLQAAAVKLFIKHSLEAPSVDDDKKTFVFRKRTFVQVCIQGIVVEMKEDRLLVDDGTGIMPVKRRQEKVSAPVSCEGIDKGSHIMVIGPLVQMADGMRHISPFHIAQLEAKNDIEQSFWFAEVVDFWRCLVK